MATIKTFRICYFREKRKRKELEKVLKIIKEKEVNITLLFDCIHYPSICGNTDEEKLAYYNRNIFENEKSRLLNKEEFCTLTEHFK